MNGPPRLSWGRKKDGYLERRGASGPAGAVAIRTNSMRNFLVAAKASDPAERTRVIQQVLMLVDQLPGVRLRVHGEALNSAFGNPPRALPIEADETGLVALQNAVGDSVAIDPDPPLQPFVTRLT